MTPERPILFAAAPLAVAIGIFGTIYGAGATALADPFVVVLSSLVVFSGSVQFAAAGLLVAGAGVPSVLVTAAMLNTRNLLLGAALRPRLQASKPRRALTAWWLTDEAAGLALTSGSATERVLVQSGLLFYSAWAIGTLLGTLGAELASLEELAAAVFPVLFVGLAALAARGRSDALRALIAAILSLGLALVFPAVRGLVPAIAAIAVALPGRRS